MSAFDPEILQDFLTESGELLEELEGDLVQLETSPTDPDLLNQIFRALHTIKGSASFLALTNLVNVAHAAESALNAARNSEITVNHAVMDLLLEAVDLLKIQFEQLQAGDDLEAPREGLCEALTEIGSGRQIESPADIPVAASATAGATASAMAGAMAGAGAGSGSACGKAGGPGLDAPPPSSSEPLDLPSSKTDLLEFLTEDLDTTIAQIGDQLANLDEPGGVDEFSETADQLVRSAEFFEFDSMKRLAAALMEVGEQFATLSPEAKAQTLPRLAGVVEVLTWQAEGIREGEMRQWAFERLCERLGVILETADLDADAALHADASAIDALVRDGVISDEQAGAIRAASSASTDTEPPEPAPPAAGDASTSAADASKCDKRQVAAVEQSIRVEVGRLESLMNLVGELVLQKNRVSAITRTIATSQTVPQELRETITASAADLDRVTSDMQTAVMRTRMQPLDKIFGKYPRLIRDLATKTGKKIALDIQGGDTEVDRSVLEELGDPLVHIIRNSADHGLESPEDRVAAGKDATGTIRIIARHAGSNVVVQIIDNGRGLPKDRIAQKAIERGLTTEADLATLSDRDIYRFVFGAGFSTAEQVSDLSGRGVGMDVVRTNIESLGGAVDIDSSPGEGTEITITIPLTIAIMPAMMVGVSEEVYAVPLDSILEIVSVDPEETPRIGQRRVLRLRGNVLPLLDGQEVFHVPADERGEPRLAVVLSTPTGTAGLLVSRVIGQQEVVIKAIDDIEHRGPISGATVRENGQVSLIVDVGQLIRESR